MSFNPFGFDEKGKEVENNLDTRDSNPYRSSNPYKKFNTYN